MAHRFKLIGKWIHWGDGERKKRVIFVGQTQAGCLDPQSEPYRITIKGCLGSDDLQGTDLVSAEKTFVILLGAKSLSSSLQGDSNGLHQHHSDRFRKDFSLEDDARLNEGLFIAHRLDPPEQTASDDQGWVDLPFNPALRRCHFRLTELITGVTLL